jgi:Flp pilus assembly protein TadD
MPDAKKAADLRAQCQASLAAGNVGAARMFAKLASLYDPDDAEARALVEQLAATPVSRGPSPSGQAARAAIRAALDESVRRERAGDVDGAIAVLRVAVAGHPGVADLHARLGALLGARARTYEEAADELLRAIELAPDDERHRVRLGEIVTKLRVRGALH